MDTLDLAEAASTASLVHDGEKRGARRTPARTPITVVIGNPPYNMGQQNENDNNKNRKYEL